MVESHASPALTVERGRSGCGGCLGYLFGLAFSTAFFAGGSVVLWMAFLGPILRIISARSWVETPCVILSSEVQGDETYEVVIRYEYDFEGERFTGSRYSFFDLRTSGRAGKEKVVAQYPEGAERTCYVDPDRPARSVLIRGFVSSMWWGLFSLPFLAVGLGGYIVIFAGRARLGRPQGESELAERPGHDRRFSDTRVTVVSDSDFDTEDLLDEPGPVTLKPEASPMGTFIGILVFALIWNGVVSVFLISRSKDWLQGKWQWFPELILVPFVLVGLFLILAVVHSFLALFNPVPLLSLSRRLIPLGGTASVDWQFDGTTRAIRRLKLMLKGVEEARYTRGTSTYTDTETFHQAVLYETSNPVEIAQGHIELQVPPEMMHSFSGENNKIKWQLQLHGDIALWPDVDATFPIRVIPHE